MVGREKGRPFSPQFLPILFSCSRFLNSAGPTISEPGTRYNQLQKYLRHCTVFWHKWPVHDLVLVISPPPLIKVASNTRSYSKLGGTTLNGREEGGQYYILQTCDQERFEARKVVFPWECLIIFATGCSSVFKIGNFKVLFSAVSTDFPQLVHVKS